MAHPNSWSARDIYYIFPILTITLVTRSISLFRVGLAYSDEKPLVLSVAHYLQGRFFVHPDTSFLAFYLASALKLAGLRTDHFLESDGIIQLPHEYLILRALVVLCGTAGIACTYASLKSCLGDRLSAAFGTCLIATETCLIAQQRLITTRSMDISMIALITWLTQRARKLQPLSINWWLAISGISVSVVCLSMTMSTSMGSAVYLYPALVLLQQSWLTIADKHAKWWSIFISSLSLVFFVLVIPGIAAVIVTFIHLKATPYSGAGDIWMSGQFRATHIDSIVHEFPAPVRSDNSVTLRHWNTHSYLSSPYENACLKTSQKYLLPSIGTSLASAPENTLWRISDPALSPENLTLALQDGHIVHVYHSLTHRAIIADGDKATSSINDWQLGVSTLPADLTSYNDSLWQIEIVKDQDAAYLVDEASQPYALQNHEGTSTVFALQTLFRLKHVTQNCYLFSRRKFLPSCVCGSAPNSINQMDCQEISCATKGIPEQSLWYVEANIDADSSRPPYVIYKPMPLMSQYLEYEKVADWIRAIIQDNELFEFWHPQTLWREKGSMQVSIFNPIVVISSFLLLIVHVLKLVGLLILRQRTQKGSLVAFPESIDYLFGWTLFSSCCFLKTGVVQTDYLPSLYFQILVAAVCFNKISRRSTQVVLGTILILSSLAFVLKIMPAIYGSSHSLAVSRELCTYFPCYTPKELLLEPEENTVEWGNTFRPINLTSKLDPILSTQEYAQLVR